jgi:hypothetical protein
MPVRLLLIVCISCFVHLTVFGQSDSSHSELRRLFDSMFRKRAYTVREPGPGAIRRYLGQEFEPYRDKPIRNIRIVVTDPFGYELTDTLTAPSNGMQRLGNLLHNRSQNWTVRQFLLFRKGDLLDPYEASESVRLMRSSGLFRDALILTENDGDSVDLYIRAVDKWSLRGSVSSSGDIRSFRLEERNFAGLGHEFSQIVQTHPDLTPGGYTGIYEVPRIENSFASLRLVYADDITNTWRKSITLERAFISPLIKWAGGITLGEYRYTDALFGDNEIIYNQGVNAIELDVWLARSFLISPLNSKGVPLTPRRNIILALSARKLDFQKKGGNPDYESLYTNRMQVLGLAGLSAIDFKPQQYLLRFGEIEYVTIGRLAGITAGYDFGRKERYAGLRIGWADLSSIGYTNFLVEVGRSFRETGRAYSILNAEATWYSNLAQAGDWRFRQFVRPTFNWGENLPLNQGLTLKDGGGIGDYRGPLRTGNSQLSIYLQTQAYAPFEILGFRMGPILFYSGSLLNESLKGLFKSPYYSAFGPGIFLRNERLVFRTIQVSVVLFPYLQSSQEFYRINGLRPWTFNPGRFRIDRPEQITFPE